ncbi:MAG TPA: hypothetical protein VGH80_08835 [Xanthomonadaceae bacterium]|jgi:hypothetical protein
MKAATGGAIAIALLGIYAYLIYVGCHLVLGCSGGPEECSKQAASGFNAVMAQTLSVIGGLLSAFIIAELAITSRGDAPVARLLADDASGRARNILQWITVAYILVWLLAGLSAFMVGMQHPDTLPALTNMGQSWLGLAVAAAYAYFGIGPA